MLEHADWPAVCTALVQDGHEAEGVLQETLVLASAKGAAAGVPDRVWLAGIVKNVTRTRRRKETRIHEREGQAAKHAAAMSSALDEVALLERQRGLLSQIKALPEAQRRAIIAGFYDGHAPRKIAATEGVSVATNHSRIQRGGETLRSRLDAEYGDRRTWAAWLTPMAQMGRRTPLAGGLVFVAGVVAFVAGAFAVRALSGSGNASEELTLPTPDLASASGLPGAHGDTDVLRAPRRCDVLPDSGHERW